MAAVGAAEQAQPATGGFDISRDALSDIVSSYMKRSAHEELEVLEQLGGSEGVMKLLGVPGAQIGLKDDPADKEHRKAVFGMNKLPERPPTPFWVLVVNVASDFMMRILMGCGLISLILGVAAPGSDPKKDWVEGFAVFVAVGVVVFVTALNDYSKEKQFQKLNAVKDDKVVSVIRAGNKHSISVFELVVGDIIYVEMGDEIPADCLMMKGFELKMDESSFTGEPDPINKSTIEFCFAQRTERAEKLAHATDKNRHHVVDTPVVISGSTVIGGSGCWLLVIAVGQSSQVGKLMGQLQGEPEPTPLQNKLENVARDIGKAGLFAAIGCLIALLIQFWAINADNIPDDTAIVQEHLRMLLVAVAVVVLAVPEGLPLAVTMALAYSISKMLEDQNWVRRLAACETMGGAQEICSDKTGTLTKNRMTVQAYWNGTELKEWDGEAITANELGGEFQQMFADSISVNSTGDLATKTIVIKDGKGTTKEMVEAVGNPTECALLQYIMKQDFKYKDIRASYDSRIVHKMPFTSDRKMMTTIVKHPDDPNKYRLFCKGASERVLRLCSQYVTAGGSIASMDNRMIGQVERDRIQYLAGQALRTICIAYRDFDINEVHDLNEADAKTGLLKVEKEMVCLGITGIRDPVRDEVPGAVKICQKAGIRVRMVTGDNIETAKQIAIKCHIYDRNTGLAMLGKEFYALVGGVVCEVCRTEVCDCPRDAKSASEKGKTMRNDVLGKPEEFEKIWTRLQVLARSQPSDKYALVTGLKNLGQVVAVTGDGTNDAPALKKADVGFAMGIAGKEVAKQAAAIVLLDDNFNSIVKAVKWGRSIYDNVRKFLQFQLTVNIVAVSLSLTCSVVIRESPLYATQLLWVNMIMDSLGALALATELPTEALLDRQPHKRGDYLINKLMWRAIGGHAVYQLTLLMIIIFAGHYFVPEVDTDTNWGRLSKAKQQELFEKHGFDHDKAVFSPHGDGKSFVCKGYLYEPFSSDEAYFQVNEYAGPSRMYTVVFNAFVMMTAFNMLNARKLYGERNVFDQLKENYQWIIIWFFIIGLNALLVEVSGVAFHCNIAGLEGPQWGFCFACAFSTLLFHQILLFIPVDALPQTGSKEVDPTQNKPTAAEFLRGRTSSDRMRERMAQGSGLGLRSGSGLGAAGGMSSMSGGLRRDSHQGAHVAPH